MALQLQAGSRRAAPATALPVNMSRLECPEAHDLLTQRIIARVLRFLTFEDERSSSLRKNLETEPLFSQVRGRWFWRWIALWSLRSAVDYAATSLGMRIRL